MIRTWLLRATDPGLDWCHHHGVLALNCLVRADLGALNPDQIRSLAPNHVYARALATMLDIQPGDQVVATDSNRNRELMIGRVGSRYAYRPELSSEHPHVCEVAWNMPRPRADVVRRGLVIPGREVPILGELQMPDHLGPLTMNHERQTRRSSAPTPAKTRARLETAMPFVGLSGRDLISTIPRRNGAPVSWIDPKQHAEEVIACNHPGGPEGRCTRHTRHRYWLALTLRRPSPQGPNVLVVGANPTWPDEPAPGNTTVNRVLTFADHLGARPPSAW